MHELTSVYLEEYFTFLAPDDIRLKGTRIGVETILYDHIHRGRTPEEIAQAYQSVTLEQVYATILYYLHNKGGDVRLRGRLAGVGAAATSRTGGASFSSCAAGTSAAKAARGAKGR